MTPRTLAEFATAAIRWAESYYRQADGNPTKEHLNIQNALDHFTRGRATLPLKLLNADALADFIEQQAADRIPRSTINARRRRILRVLKWAAQPPRRWITPAQLADCTLAEPLKAHRSTAQETDPVPPADHEAIVATLAAPDLPLKVATMIELQLHTGMRPGEVCRLKRSELHPHPERTDMLQSIPARHKSAHRGRTRIICFGPQAAFVLLQWIKRLPEDQDAVFACSPNWYQTQIARIQQKHNLTRWTPNQLRHSFATNLRAAAGLDAVQVALGHADIRTTQRYAVPQASGLTAALALHG